MALARQAHEKVRKAMENSKKYPIEELVDVEEFTVEGKEINGEGMNH